ncbi:MAG: hypothetical protein M3Y13_11375, partial [Armatimonadota bacterium]|nr:hypothetical protein [Armatimonadota bacterium]
MTDITTPTAEEIARVRAIADQIGQKMGSDKSFKAQYDADPHSTLTAQGMPSAAAREYSRRLAQASGQNEVAG